jgi:hypothetical protein
MVMVMMIDCEVRDGKRSYVLFKRIEDFLYIYNQMLIEERIVYVTMWITCSIGFSTPIFFIQRDCKGMI